MDQTMRAAQITAPEQIEIVQVPRPVPGADEALVKIESCGVCSSNIPPWEGRPWFTYPFAPGALGHEATGQIMEMGKHFPTDLYGRRVALLSQQGYAEYEVVKADACVPLSARLDGELFPGEPLGCAMNILERARIEAGDRVAIVGIGFLGALLVELAVRAGAQVIALARSETSQRWIQSSEVTFVAAKTRADAVTFVGEHTKNGWCDVVIEATGKQEPLHLAGELTCEGGRLVIAGYHQDGLREINLQLWNWRGLDVINAHERDPKRYYEGVKRAAKAVASGALNPKPLLTHRLPLEDLNEALKLTRDRPPDFMKAMIIP